jgi:hypothetical protein
MITPPQGLSGNSTVIDYQIFTSSGTYTKPADAKMIYVEAIGGGGGGGNGVVASAGYGGGGGGGGGCITAVISAALLSDTETVTIGAAAECQTSGNYSAFGTWVRAIGGIKGGNATTSSPGSGGNGGAGQYGASPTSGYTGINGASGALSTWTGGVAAGLSVGAGRLAVRWTYR